MSSLAQGAALSGEKPREKIINDAEGQELRDNKISRLIAALEMYCFSARKGATINRVESKGGSGGSDRQREPSKKKFGLVCFKCGEEGHFKSDCQKLVFCDVCKSEGHSNATCFSQNNKVNKSTLKKEGKSSSKNRSKNKKGVSKKVSGQGEDSSEEVTVIVAPLK